MTIELTMLLWSVILAFVLIMIPASDALRLNGVLPLFGNRGNLQPPSPWGGRAQRAAANMFESLPLFAALVLIAHVTGTSSPTTILGAQLFFWGRVAHAIFYLAGIPYLRTGAWVVAVVGMGMIVGELL